MSDMKWDLTRLSAGERNALKRNAGIMMNAATMQSIEAYYRAQVGNCRKYEEKARFAAMCMQCLWREEDHPTIKPFPEILRAIYQNPDATDSIRKRCTSFMDLSWGDDGFLLGKICNLVRKIRADDPGVIPDFALLADDLNQWNNESHYIQRQWLNTICRTQFEQEKNEEAENDVD